MLRKVDYHDIRRQLREAELGEEQPVPSSDAHIRRAFEREQTWRGRGEHAIRREMDAAVARRQAKRAVA